MDLKANRENNTLLILGALAEPSAPAGKIADKLASELRDLAGWLELDAIEASDRGGLASHLRNARP